MLWLDSSRGYLSDWITQRWVQLTGCRVDLTVDPWLEGLVGPTTGIGTHFFDDAAVKKGLRVHRSGPERGLLERFDALGGPAFDPAAVDPAVATFYERTSAYEMDVSAKWRRAFRPFGGLLTVLFSRRLQQLNMPLSPLDTSRGMTSEVMQLIEPASGQVRYTAWVRRLHGTGNVLYAGSYAVCQVPGCADPCVKVVFPLPNGNAILFLRPEAQPDRSFSLTSAGQRFGDPGFYFTIHTPRGVYACYLRTFKESIRVYTAEDGFVHADHLLALWRVTFLRLHYCLRPLNPSYQ
jgi:hypothetical protein